jgi:hypothetical protein
MKVKEVVEAEGLFICLFLFLTSLWEKVLLLLKTILCEEFNSYIVGKMTAQY